jgi:multidrug/hemolysin transport system permease protein
MSVVWAFTKRNLICFFREPGAIIAAFLTLILGLGMYIFFLRGMLIDNTIMQWGIQVTDHVPGLVDTWVLAGVMAIAAIATSSGTIQTSFEDRIHGQFKDFMVTPAKRYEIGLGYVLSTFIFGMIVGVLILVAAEIFLAIMGMGMGVAAVLYCIVMLVPATLSSTIISFSVVNFVKSPAAFTGLFTLICMVSAIFSGAFVPIGNLPGFFQQLVALVPATHMVAIFRQAMCTAPMEELIDPADQPQFMVDMGYDLYLGDFEFSVGTSLLYVAVVTFLFFLIFLVSLHKK